MQVEVPRADDARVGTVLDQKWTLERLLGKGGIGAVYAARHRNGARAAIKLLHPEMARVDGIRERFLREGYAANKVDHPGAVKVLDDHVIQDGPDAGTAYLVMELLDGEPLSARISRDPPLTERDVLVLMDDVLSVLDAAHAQGVVHRDLKPENLFLVTEPQTGRVRVKVLDFGVARVAEGHRLTGSGVSLGTPSYMSPEQAAGRVHEIDGRTDLFALGATVFRVLAGRPVHEASNVVAIVVRHAIHPAPPLRSVVPAVGEALARIIDRALAFERDERYPDAKTMREEVRAALDLLDAAEKRTAPAPSSSSFDITGSRRRLGFGVFLFAAISIGGAIAALTWGRPASAEAEAGAIAAQEVLAAMSSIPEAIETPILEASEAPDGGATETTAAVIELGDAGVLEVDDNATATDDDDDDDDDPDAGTVEVDGGADDTSDDDEEPSEVSSVTGSTVAGTAPAAVAAPPPRAVSRGTARPRQPHRVVRPRVKKRHHPTARPKIHRSHHPKKRHPKKRRHR